MDKSLILCLYFPARGEPHYALTPNTLEAFQRVVGGYIETMPYGGHTLIVNEEGALIDMPINRHIRQIFGNAILVDVEGDDFTDLKTCPCCGKAISKEALIEVGIALEVIGR